MEISDQVFSQQLVSNKNVRPARVRRFPWTDSIVEPKLQNDTFDWLCAAVYLQAEQTNETGGSGGPRPGKSGHGFPKISPMLEAGFWKFRRRTLVVGIGPWIWRPRPDGRLSIHRGRTRRLASRPVRRNGQDSKSPLVAAVAGTGSVRISVRTSIRSHVRHIDG